MVAVRPLAAVELRAANGRNAAIPVIAFSTAWGSNRARSRHSGPRPIPDVRRNTCLPDWHAADDRPNRKVRWAKC